ncbi:MAG: type IV pilus modification protein PilV [Gammaproteobacteria bacterium]|nr:type IV pilus modification protein PilV [Gammaproteobacteria bacterium]
MNVDNKTSRVMSGFTLIEMLVAIVVLSIGLLGVAALQSRGQQLTYGANVRTQGAILAYEIMDRIRANGTFAKDDVISGPGDGKGYIENEKPTGIPDCMTDSCAAAELRTFDLGEWYDRLAASLPGGTGKITASLKGGSTVTVEYVIEITWALQQTETREAGIDDAQPKTKTLRWMMRL